MKIHPISTKLPINLSGQDFGSCYASHELTRSGKVRLLMNGKPDVYRLKNESDKKSPPITLLRLAEKIVETEENEREEEKKIEIEAGTLFVQSDSGMFFQLHDPFDLPGMDAVLPYLRNPLWRPCFVPGLVDTFELTWSRGKECEKYDSVTFVSGAKTLVGQLDDSTESRCLLASLSNSAQFYFFNPSLNYCREESGDRLIFKSLELGCGDISGYLHNNLKGSDAQIDSSLNFGTEGRLEIKNRERLFSEGVDIWCLNAESQPDSCDQAMLVRTKVGNNWFIGSLTMGFVYLPDFFADFVRDYSNEIKNNTRIFKMGGLEPLIVEFPDPDDEYKIQVRYAERNFDPEYIIAAEKKAWVLAQPFMLPPSRGYSSRNHEHPDSESYILQEEKDFSPVVVVRGIFDGEIIGYTNYYSRNNRGYCTRKDFEGREQFAAAAGPLGGKNVTKWPFSW